MQEVADAMSRVARTVALALAESLGHDAAAAAFPAGCDETTCFLRLNRYPACPFAADTFGLVPHTDSDFLTVLCQDQVGGLQLMKDSRWVAVKPRPDALIVNIGDLFQVTYSSSSWLSPAATPPPDRCCAAKHIYIRAQALTKQIARDDRFAASLPLCVDYMWLLRTLTNCLLPCVCS
jgi:hypothetical protein